MKKNLSKKQVNLSFERYTFSLCPVTSILVEMNTNEYQQKAALRRIELELDQCVRACVRACAHLRPCRMRTIALSWLVRAQRGDGGYF
jgi:hypothetical protein